MLSTCLCGRKGIARVLPRPCASGPRTTRPRTRRRRTLNTVTQPTFAGPMTFDDGGWALHRHSATPSDDLVLFVHGLGGSGNGTWRKFPAFVFDSPVKHDVAVYNYRTLHRRLGTVPPTLSG